MNTKRKVRANLDPVTDHTAKPIQCCYHSGRLYFKRKHARASISVPLQDVYEKLAAKQTLIRL